MKALIYEGSATMEVSFLRIRLELTSISLWPDLHLRERCSVQNQPAEMVENISGVGLIEMRQSCKVHVSPVGVVQSKTLLLDSSQNTWCQIGLNTIILFL